MNVKDLRTKLNLTQHELAAITGIPRDRIAKWEQGKGSPKGVDNQMLTTLEKVSRDIGDLNKEIGTKAQIIPVLKFGAVVKRKREKAGLSWEELGTMLGIDGVLIKATELGIMNHSHADLKVIWDWAGVDSNEFEEAVKNYNLPRRSPMGLTEERKGIDPDFHEFLKGNDAFFKNQYTSFNAQVLANLTALMNQQKNLEALLKINLEHTGSIEAAQLGVPAEQIHDKINTEILAAAGVEIDNGVRSPGKG